MTAPTTRMTPRTPNPAATAAAPFVQIVLAQTRIELTMTLRRGESLLITVLIPIGALIVTASPVIHVGSIYFLLPGILTLAIMSTGMVSLGIATAYERYYGVLKRLGTSPLSRTGLVLAKALAVLVVEIGQVILLILIGAIFYGWRPTGSLIMTLLVMLIGSATFVGLGMLMAGGLRAEATLAGANALYLVFLVIPGVLFPLKAAPGFVQAIAQFLPSTALAMSLRGAMTNAGTPLGPLLILIAWCVIFLVATGFTFKWE